MAEPTGMGGLVDVETALRREVDILAERFPETPRTDVDQCVRETYAELERQAHVEAHLLAVTRAQVTEKLRARGETMHLRGEDG
jgi:hypothetical protein